MNYWICNKCGAVSNDEISPSVCTMPMPVRTSGICGGGFSKTGKAAFNLQILNFRIERARQYLIKSGFKGTESEEDCLAQTMGCFADDEIRRDKNETN